MILKLNYSFVFGIISCLCKKALETINNSVKEHLFCKTPLDGCFCKNSTIFVLLPLLTLQTRSDLVKVLKFGYFMFNMTRILVPYTVIGIGQFIDFYLKKAKGLNAMSFNTIYLKTLDLDWCFKLNLYSHTFVLQFLNTHWLFYFIN